MKFIKNILSLVMAVSIIAMSSVITVNASDMDNLESGIYEVENDVYHESEIGMSMSRTYLNPTMKVEINDEDIFYTIGFTGTDYMENYRIVEDGEETKAEIVKEDPEEKSIYLKFKAKSIKPNIKAKIYVDAMGRDVEFDILTKTDTFKLIEKIDEPEEKVKNTEKNKKNKNYSVEDKSNNTPILIGIGGLLVIGLGIIAFRKGNKNEK